jgi:two-component system response regulator TctD
MNVLLLEDDERVARGLAAVATTDGHRVFHARTVAEAAELLEKEPIEVFVADMGLAGNEDGLEALRSCKARHPAVARVLMTGARGIGAGGAGQPWELYAAKPFGRAEFRNLLEKAYELVKARS